MPINFLEQLVAEWYEYRGFFVRRNVNVGKRTAGGHEGELDVVAFHPVEKLLVQIETSRVASRSDLMVNMSAWKRSHLKCDLDAPNSKQIASLVFIL